MIVVWRACHYWAIFLTRRFFCILLTNFTLTNYYPRLGNQRVTERDLGRPEPVVAPAGGGPGAGFRNGNGRDHSQREA
jgi:hypothetical protein